MAGLCEGGNEPPGSLKSKHTSYNGWGDNRANHTIPPFWLDDRPPLLRHVGVRPAAGWNYALPRDEEWVERRKILYGTGTRTFYMLTLYPLSYRIPVPMSD
ncbi:hypothetical protein ANN_13538 [Periplaneta americana]|uniref:Uncharacterized protein n=1 Tax=Periplaneta americana TaxID=6978 RepID=A0ABQ8TM39_PERAM|nr:hypothetical protein ANN_13538 [Periplaneta americana]